jgi:hypothetical protein
MGVYFADPGDLRGPYAGPKLPGPSAQTIWDRFLPIHISVRLTKNDSGFEEKTLPRKG